MTKDEIRQDCVKFCDYLKANGHTPVAHTIMFSDGMSYSFGGHEMLEELMLVIVADRLGFKMVPK